MEGTIGAKEKSQSANWNQFVFDSAIQLRERTHNQETGSTKTPKTPY